MGVWSDQQERIRNETIRNEMKVTEIHKKVQERRLGWYGHVMQMDENYVGKRVLAMEVKSERRKGRPCRSWTDCVQEDLKEKGIRKQHTEERNEWKRLIRNGDPV